jgi:hypothetical protein
MKFMADRLAVCAGCEHRRWLVDQYLTQCTACNCVIEFKATVPWARCPKNKWTEHTDIDADVRDLIINDTYLSLSLPETPYKSALRAKFTQVFGSDADIVALWNDLQERRNRG